MFSCKRLKINLKNPILKHMNKFSNSAAMRENFNVALCQLRVGKNKEYNISHTAEIIDSTEKSDIIILPECWNSPYSTSAFPEYAETIPEPFCEIDSEKSPSISMLAKKAVEKKAWVIGGSIPERSGDQIFNTCAIIDTTGTLVAKHRKIHLFDIDVPGKIKFKESDSLTGGSSPTLIDTPFGLIGIGICYDIRFPEYSQMLREMGAIMLVFPGAFNMTTGPAHWELLQRARAVDNQLYVVACSPSRIDPENDKNKDGVGYVAWGHSTVVSPWGDIVATTDEKESVVYAQINHQEIDNMRNSIPCWKQKRNDLYKLEIVRK